MNMSCAAVFPTTHNRNINVKKIKFEYWKYAITNKLEKKIVSTPVVSPYAIVYSKKGYIKYTCKEY